MTARVMGTLLTWLFLMQGAGTAQSVRSTIAGAVTDSGSGAAVAGARVTLTQEETNRRREAVTDARGEFLFTVLPPGTYRLEVALQGFRTHLQQLTLQVNQELRVDVPLIAGTLAQQVEVRTTPARLRTERMAVGSVILNRQVVDLPLDGRDFFDLALLLPGTAPPAPGSAGSVRGDFAVNVNGGREDANVFLLDGVYNGDPKLNGFAVNPPVDAILEFEVLSHTSDASFGRNPGGQINVALRSGSNRLHGSAYEFFRNAALDARNAFAPAAEPAPKYQRNQFGLALGGPLRRDRTFFFADYEGRVVREGITRVTNVPTLAERSGDFSQSFLPPPIDPSTGEPFPDGKIPEPFLHPIGTAVAGLYPQPNRPIPGQNFVSSPTQRDNAHHFDARLDHSLGNGTELMARYSFVDRNLYEPFSGPTFAAVPGFGTDVPRRAQNAVVAATHAFSPVLLNDLRVAFNRVAAGAVHENQGRSLNQQVGMPELSSNPRDFGLSFMRVTGFSPLGDEFNNPQHSVSNTFQVIDHATWVRGRALVKFGGDFRVLQQNAFRDVQSRGFLNFLGLFTGNPLADLLLGLPTLTGGARLDNPQRLRAKSSNLFAHTTWRARSDLTLNLGLRYEFNAPPVDALDRASIYDPATQSLVQVGTAGIPRSGYHSDRNNFGPRAGLAWTLGSSQTTVLRAGYGVYFDQTPLAPGEGLYFNAPYFDFRLFFPLPGLPLTLEDPFPEFFPVTLPPSALSYQRNLRTPYVQHWNFNIQQMLGRSRVVEVGYVGTKGTKLLAARDINQPAPSPVVPNLRPVPQFDDINLVESRASSNYHALQVRFQQSFEQGLGVLAGYTWSKSIDDASNFFSSAGDPNFPQDSWNLGGERGRSNFDLRQRFTLAYGWDFPFGEGKCWARGPGWVSALLGNWQSFGILTFQTGRPFTVALLPEIDNSNTGRSILGFGANDRPNLVGDPSVVNPAPGRWFNPSAFEMPPFGSFGSAGRNILEGPGHATVNFSLVKTVKTGERTSLQFRAESFNLFNRANFGFPDNFFGSPTFGQILSADIARRIQFGLKVLF
jgi:hypothetical protein